MASKDAAKRHEHYENTIAKYNLRNRTPEERRAIARKSAEVRKKKRQEKLALQKSMQTLLELPLTDKKKVDELLKMGFCDDETTNKTLLMARMFKIAINGDVTAMKEIVNMMNKLDLYEETGKVDNNVIININTAGTNYKLTENDEREIEKALNSDFDENDELLQKWD